METPLHPEPTGSHLPAPAGRARPPIGLLLIFVLVAVGLFALGFYPRKALTALVNQRSKNAAKAIPVVPILTPHRVPESGITLPASINGARETSVQARTSGYVTKWLVDIGTRVKKGQLLAEIASPDADQQLYQAQAQTSQSEANVGQAQAAVAQQKATVAQMQANVKHARAAVEQAKATLASTQGKLQNAMAAKLQAQATVLHSQAQVQAQHATVEQQKASVALATTNYKRERNLLGEGFVAQQDVDSAYTTLRTARDTLTAAEAAEHSADADVTAAQQGVNAADANVSSAKEDVEAAKKTVDAADADVQAAEETVNSAQASLQASQKNVQASRAAVSASQANTRYHKVITNFEKVVAPFDGVITARNVDVGTLISAGGGSNSSSSTGGTNAGGTINTSSPTTSNTNPTPTSGLFGIADVSLVRIYVQVPQSFATVVQEGSAANVTVREIPGRTFTGRVVRRAGALDPTSRTLLTEVDLPNPGGVLLPGMFASVTLEPEHPTSALRVADSTLIVNSQGTRIAVVTREGTVHFQTITVGRDFGYEIEVLDGLTDRQHVIDNPPDNLKEGQKVKGVRADSPKAGGRRRGGRKGGAGGGPGGGGAGGEAGGESGGAGGGAHAGRPAGGDGEAQGEGGTGGESGSGAEGPRTGGHGHHGGGAPGAHMGGEGGAQAGGDSAPAADGSSPGGGAGGGHHHHHGGPGGAGQNPQSE